MTNWIETHRGTVPPWQCDVTEHFTVGYYFDRLEESGANLAEALGIAEPSRPGRMEVRFARELRAGASFHVESAALGVDEQSGLRLGHRFIDSVNGEVVTWCEEHWDLSAAPLTSGQRHAIAGKLAEWNGPAAEKRGEPVATAGFIPTARGRVKPGDLDAGGHFGLGAMVLRFSNASGQAGAAIGMDTAYMQQQRRGFSTFELRLRLFGSLPVDTPYLIESGVGHLGGSSLRLIHRLTNPRDGMEIARLGQFGVNLDLDARRPARWPDAIRERAAALVIEVV